MPSEIRTLRTREDKDGKTWALQQRIEKGKRPHPLGWVLQGNSEAASTAAKSTTARTTAETARTAKTPSAPPSTASSSKAAAAAEASNFIGWIAGAAATAGVILGGMWLLANRP